MALKESTFFPLTSSDAQSTCGRATRDCNRKAEWRTFVGRMLLLYDRNCDLVLATRHKHMHKRT